MSYPNTFATQAGPIPLSQLDANFNFAVDIQSQSLYAAAGGTSDVITATFFPVVTALISGLTLYVRASASNTTTTPTFSPNGLTAVKIVKNSNTALAAGDIAGAGHILILQYDGTLNLWKLANPAAASGGGTVTAVTGSGNIASSGGTAPNITFTGTLPVANGGTGLATTPANGALDIGNGTGFTRTTLTAGSNITITNGAGSISIASTAAGVSGGQQVFTASGTFTIPAGITQAKVTVVGGGGDGGALSSAGAAGGGGGGGAAIVWLTGLTPANTITVTVGSNAGTSSIASGTQTITTVSATGGTSVSSGAGGGGSGGLGSNGTINIKGGGGGAGVSTAGGVGGSSIIGGGGAAVITSNNGLAGGNYGGGGSGAVSSSASRTGGTGAGGIVIFEY